MDYGGDRRRRRMAGVGFDVDARNFFDAVILNGGSISSLERNAYNVYRIDVKTNANAWNGDAIIDLPMIGGTVEGMVVNAQNPGQFDQIAVNTVAGDFTANGWTPNAVNSYFRMALIPSVDLTINSVAMEYYSRDNSTNGSVMGCHVTNNQRLFLNPRHVTLDFFVDCYDTVNGRLTRANANSRIGATYSRVANNDARAFVNGVQLGVTLVTTGGSQPNIEFYLGAFNNAGAPGSFTDRECAGTGIYDGLSPAKSLAQYTARQTMNTTLSRNV